MSSTTNTRKRRRKSDPTPAVFATVAVAAVVMVLVFLFVINHWTVEITLNGDEKVLLEPGETYVEQGAEATASGTVFRKDPRKLEVTIEGGEKIDTNVPGAKYTVTYKATYMFATGKAEREVVVIDHEPPVIELKSDPEAFTPLGEAYVEEGYTAHDNVDGDITDKVVKSGKDGGIIVYTVEDSSGNVTTVERKINYKDMNAPTIVLNGDPEMTINAGDSFNDPGCTATDKEDGDISSGVTVEGEVNIYMAGTYTLVYIAKDSCGNSVSTERKVTVKAKPQQQTGGNEGGEHNIYLTFDDGPSQYTPELLDILKKYNVKVTFFVINANPSTITREYNEGHTVAIHSYTHKYDVIYASDSAFFNDLSQMSSVIEKQTGHKPTMMRFPGGGSNTISANYSNGIMTRLTQAVTDAGYTYFDWNVSSGDAGETTSTDQVFRNVVDGCSGRKNSVVLQHDTKKFSIDAVERIINWGISNGYTFLPLTPSSPTMHHGVNN